MTRAPLAAARRVAVLDGQVFPDGSARVSAWDRGLLLGDGLFETMRAYDGRVFRLASLNQHPPRVVTATCPTRDLHQQMKGPLRGAKIRHGQRRVGIEHAHQSHVG